MAKTQLYSGRARTTNAGVTNFRQCSIGQSSVGNSSTPVNDNVQTARAIGTYSNLLFHLPVNSATSPSTGAFIKDATGPTAGNQTVSFSAGAVNEQEDVTNTDVTSAGNTICFRFINGGGGSNTEGLAGMCFSATVNTSSEYGSFNISASSTAGATKYFRVCSGANSATEDATLQLKMKTAGTFKYGCAGIIGSGSAHTGATSFGTRVSGVTGAILVSLATGVTGQVEDVTHADAVPVDALVNTYTLTGTGSGGAGTGLLLYVFETTDSTQMSVVVATSGGDPTFATSATAYLPLNGQIQNTVTTESDCQTKAGVATLYSLAEAFVSANGITATSTVGFRNSRLGAGAQAISIGSGVTGWVTDVTNSDPVTVTDELDLQVATGASGTTIALSTVAAKQYIYTSPWTVSAAGTYGLVAQATSLVFEAIGGMGGGTSGGVSLGGNGASGSDYTKTKISGLTVGNVYTFVDGAAGATDADGGDSYWDNGSLAISKGGKTNGNVPSGAIGDTIFHGGTGGSAGSTGGGGGGGSGGSGGAGGNGAAGGIGTGGAGGTAGAGSGIAGGAGGAVASPGVSPGGGGGTAHVGGAGQAGIVTLTWPAPSPVQSGQICW